MAASHALLGRCPDAEFYRLGCAVADLDPDTQKPLRRVEACADNDLPAYYLNRRSVDPKPVCYLPHPVGASRSLESSHNALLKHILDGEAGRGVCPLYAPLQGQRAPFPE